MVVLIKGPVPVVAGIANGYYRGIHRPGTRGVRDMATATRRRHTPADLLKIDDRLMPELIDGELMEREPIGQEADSIASSLAVYLVSYSQATLPGVVNGGQCGFQIFSDDPDKVRIPDAAFTRRDRLPKGRSYKGHSRVAPELAVEIISPNDLATKVRRKVRDFLDAGIPLVWVVCPESRDVAVYRADGTGALRKEGETLDGEGVLPGFSCPVAALFEGLNGPPE